MRPIQNVLIARGLRPLVAWLTRGWRRRWLLIAAGFFALVGGLALFFWWGDLTSPHSRYFGALTAEFEETKGGYKGLEAFVLSELDEKVNDTLKHTYVTEGFVAAFN